MVGKGSRAVGIGVIGVAVARQRQVVIFFLLMVLRDRDGTSMEWNGKDVLDGMRAWNGKHKS